MFVVTYVTESGDGGVVGVFQEPPTEGHLSAIAVRDYSHEVIEEDGELYKLIHFTVSGPFDFDVLPEPIDPIEGP